MIPVSPELYERELDRWLADVRAEAIRLHASDVPVEQCAKLAIEIVTARDVSKLRRAQQLATGPMGRVAQALKQ